jgi:hypothetical protein
MKTIEGRDFSSLLGLANNPDMLHALIVREPTVQQLVVYLNNLDNAKALLYRIDALLREQDDIRFRNNSDAALAVYLWVLSERDATLGRLAASLVLAVPRLWWARRSALGILNGALPDSSTQQSTQSITTTSGWTASTNAEKESMILAEPLYELVREERVLNPSSVNTTGTTQSSLVTATESQLTDKNLTLSTVTKA